MKKYIVVILFCIVLAFLLFVCSVDYNANINSISEFGDELILKYPVIEKIEVKLNQAQVIFKLDIKDNYESKYLESIYEESKIFFMREDIQNEFIEKHYHKYKSWGSTVDALNQTNFPEIIICFELEDDDIKSFYYEAEYHKFDLDIGVRVIDRYQTWHGPEFY